MTVKLVSDFKLPERTGTALREAARGFMVSLRASASHAPGSIGALENTLAMISYYALVLFRLYRLFRSALTDRIEKPKCSQFVIRKL